MGIILYGIVFVILVLFVIFKIKPKKSKNIKGRHVVITGGSSGIGLQIAIECVSKGAHVTVIARNVQLLEETVKLLQSKKINEEQKISYRSLDISRSYTDVRNALSDVEKRIGPIYMLVNCAGLAICGTIEDISIDDAKHLMDVNYFGTYYCTHYVLPKMKNAGEGIIVMTASQAALFGIYGYGPYAASKFALRGLAETLAMESRHKGVSVTLALPCDTDTPGFENEEKSKPEVTKIISGSGGLADPEKVGKQILTDALNGSFFSILGMESWLITLLCCGMAPWGSIGLNLLQALLMGPLRIIGVGLQWHFSRIIKHCAKQKRSIGIQVKLCKCEDPEIFNENEGHRICSYPSIQKEKINIEILNNSTENNKTKSLCETDSVINITSSPIPRLSLSLDDDLLRKDGKMGKENINFNGNESPPLTSKSFNEKVMEIIERTEGLSESCVQNLITDQMNFQNDNIKTKVMEFGSIDHSFSGEFNFYSPLENPEINLNGKSDGNPLINSTQNNFNKSNIANSTSPKSEMKYENNEKSNLNFKQFSNNEFTPVSLGFHKSKGSFAYNLNNRPILKARRRFQKLKI